MSAAGLLDYVTYKYVILKDRRLGIGYYVLVVSILVYTITEVFIRKGYLKFDTSPQGVVRAILSDDLANESFDPSQLTYCVEGALRNISCRYEDPLELNWPVEGRAVTITTFAKDKLQRSHPLSNSPSDEYDLVNETHYYTQGPEFVVIKVDHAVVASLFTDRKGTEKLAAAKRAMNGYLISHSGEVVRELGVLGKPDKITLQELLESGGIPSLDMPSDALNAKGQNYRQRGGILRVSIHYQNWYDTWIGTSDIKYFYRVRYIPFMDYNTKQVLPYYGNPAAEAGGSDETTKWRILRKRYAIRVEFEQHGSLGMFSVSTLLLKLASGMGLLTLSATIIDIFALYILPNKNQYRKHVYQPSEIIKQKNE